MATELGKAYVQIVPSAKGIKGSIEAAIGGEAESAGKSAGGKLSGAIGGALGGIGNILKVGFGAAVAGVTAASGAVAAFGKEAVESYASYEQLVGGVDKLYGEASGKLQQYADDAYKTAGMSANQYMETATSFSAALVNSLGGDEITVCPDGCFVGSGVLHCPVLAQCPDQFIIDHAVLRGDFCRGVSGLAASDAVGLQNDDLVPRLLKCVGNQYPRHAGADDGNLGLPILRQALPGSDLTALGPDGFH